MNTLDTSQEDRGQGSQLLGCLMESKGEGMFRAFILIRSGATVSCDDDLKPNRLAKGGGGMVEKHVGLEEIASAHAVRQMAGRDLECARAAFPISSEDWPAMMIAVRYTGDPSILPESLPGPRGGFPGVNQGFGVCLSGGMGEGGAVDHVT